jgi:hypothetical protein
METLIASALCLLIKNAGIRKFWPLPSSTMTINSGFSSILSAIIANLAPTFSMFYTLVTKLQPPLSTMMIGIV